MKMWKIKKEGGFPPLGGTAALADASPEELRVLLCLVEAEACGRPFSAEALAAGAGVSAARVGSALRYWQEVGVLEEGGDEEKTAPSASEVAEDEKKKAVKKPVVGKEVRPLGGEETAAVVEREQLGPFIDACQQLAGRVLSTPDLQMLVSLADELPFSQEYLITLASFCKRRSAHTRFSVRYFAQVAYDMLERECLSEAQLEAYIASYEKFAGEEWQIRKLLGIGERRLTPKERNYFIAWTGYGYGVEIIGIAYDIAVDRTGKISLPYMDKLLGAFYAAGCQNEADVRAYLERERGEHEAKKLLRHGSDGKREAAGRSETAYASGKGGKTYATGKSEKDKSATAGSSFRSSDYMAAALRRSYGDDGEE